MRHRSSILLFYSSDDTEFIRRFPAKAITHGFTRRRPIRSLKIPPEVRKSPTDFTDIHRFFIGVFFSHADFADDADFIHHDFSSSDFTDESEAFLLIGLLTEFRRTLAADQWLAPDICSCCFLSHRFHRYTQIFYGISGESLCQSQGVSATTGQVASVKIRE